MRPRRKWSRFSSPGDCRRQNRGSSNSTRPLCAGTTGCSNWNTAFATMLRDSSSSRQALVRTTPCNSVVQWIWPRTLTSFVVPLGHLTCRSMGDPTLLQLPGFLARSSRSTRSIWSWTVSWIPSQMWREYRYPTAGDTIQCCRGVAVREFEVYIVQEVETSARGTLYEAISRQYLPPIPRSVYMVQRC